MAEPLRPCPFCGSVTLLRMVGKHMPVHCNRCGADASDWNRRTPGPATQAMLEYAKVITATARQMDQGQGFKPDLLKMVQEMEAFLAEWSEPSTKGGA